MQPDASSTETLRLIEHKRKALEAVVRIARAIEKFEQSLEAVLLLRRSSMQIPRTVFKTFRALETQFEERSNTEVEQAIQGLENLLQRDLAEIFEITQAGGEQMLLSAARTQGADHTEQEVEEIDHLLEAFRRRSQTAVYLRVLLRERGVKSEPFRFNIDDEDIQSHINILMAEEAHYRNRILAGIEEVCADIDAMMGSESLPEGLRESLQETRRELEANREGLRAGRKVEDIPFRFEAISVAEPGGESPVPADEDVPADASMPDPAPRATPQPRGFLCTCYLWLTTPWRTRWSDIRSGRWQPGGHRGRRH